jgi:hypothetical protein
MDRSSRTIGAVGVVYMYYIKGLLEKRGTGRKICFIIKTDHLLIYPIKVCPYGHHVTNSQVNVMHISKIYRARWNRLRAVML